MFQCEKYGYEFENKLGMSDYRYYSTRVEEKKYTVDQNALKEYFPLSVVTTGLLQIYQVTNLLVLRIYIQSNLCRDLRDHSPGRQP